MFNAYVAPMWGFRDRLSNWIFRVEQDGSVFAKAIEFEDGTSLSTAGGTLPPVIDEGTF